MVQVIIVSENKSCQEIFKSAKRLLGKLVGFSCLSLSSSKKISDLEAQVFELLRKIGPHDEVLFLLDLFGSTQSNVCLKFVKKGKIEMLTGFNLPMLIKLATLNQHVSLKELTSLLQNYGKQQIRHIESKNPKL